MSVWTGFICLGIGSSGGACEHTNELSGPIKHWDFQDQLSDC
jgi:hypothetical protein